jgi:hypothetical protein
MTDKIHKKENAMPTVAEVNAQLKNNLEVSEKLRQRRKEIKTLLYKDGLAEAEEFRLADELRSVSKALGTLEEHRMSLYSLLPTAT